MGCSCSKEIITEKKPNPQLLGLKTYILNEGEQKIIDDEELEEQERNFFRRKTKTQIIESPRRNQMYENAELDLTAHTQLIPKRFRKSLTFQKVAIQQVVNLSALCVVKYYKNQEPPKDKSKLYKDELFPPCIDSLFPKVKRLSSLLVGKSLGQKYVDKQFFSAFNFKKEDIEWYRASEIFPEGKYSVFENKIEVDDILQGNVGNCYFMSSLAAMCKNPQLIMELFRDLNVTSNGCYEVVMRIDGIWQVMLLDDYFPCHKDTKKPLFAQSNGNELWVMLLEKAWAKANGCYYNMIGGWSSEVLFSLTTFPVYEIDHSKMDKDELWTKLKYLLDRDNIVTCTSKHDSSIEKNGLVSGHSFTVIKMKEGLIKNRLIKLIRLRNPWGYKEWSGRFGDKSKEWTDETRQVFDYHRSNYKSEDDGEFYMEFYDYLRNFFVTEVCQVSRNICSKGIQIEELDGGSVFEITIKELSDIKIQAVKRSGRFNSKIPKKAELNMNIILLKKENIDELGKVKFSYLDSNTDAIFNPFINKVLSPGNYVVYVYADYNFSNFDKKRKYTLNVSSDNEFKVTTKAVDNNFTILQEIISSCLIQLVADKKEFYCSTNCDISHIISNRFQKTSYGIVYFKNERKNESITVKITDKSTNMYLLVPKDRPQVFTIKIAPNEDYCIIGIRKQYYEEFCFNLEFNYIVTEEKYAGLKKKLQSKLVTVTTYNPELLEVQKKNYFDFAHSWFPINLKNICSIINSKGISLDIYSNKYPEEMEELKTVPNLSDYEEVIFYDKYYSEEGYYFGEWKLKNSFIKHGRGMFVYNKDDKLKRKKFVGQMQNGNKHGLGIMFYNNGDIIEIDFYEDEMQGVGIKTNKNGIMKNVEYNNDKLVREYKIEEIHEHIDGFYNNN